MPAKIITGLFAGLILVSSCHDKKTESPYAAILSRPPFRVLTDSIKKFPEDDGLYFRRAVLLNSNNQPGPALADFQKAWSIKKEERYAFGIGNLLLDRQPDSAILFLQNAVRDLPASYLLQLTLARSLAAGNRTDEALQACNELLQQSPGQVEVLKFKAELLAQKNDNSGAISLLQQAYQLAPFDIDLNYELAFKYAEAKDPRVLSLCDSLMKADSLQRHAEPYYYKGIYYSNTGNKSAALQQFEAAIGHDYTYLNAYIEKGRVLYEQKKFSDALAVFQLANRISIKFPDAWYWMGKCEEALGRKEDARLDYERAVGLDPSFTEAKEAVEKIKN